MLDVRRLRMLSALERLGTVAAVAEALHQTASGISMQLTALERDVGVALTERQGRRLALAPAGRLLAQHGHEILERLSVAELEVDALRSGAVGRFTVAAFPTAAGSFVATAWRRLIGERTGMEIRLTTLEPEPALAAVAAGRADLAVVHTYSNVARDLGKGITTRHLADEPVWLACRVDDPAHDHRPTATLTDFAEHPWLAAPPEVTCYAMVERACALAGFRPDVVAETMDFTVQLELVAAGAGVALIPDLALGTVPAGVELRELTTPVRRSIFLAARTPRFADPGVAKLADLLAATARERLARQPSQRRQ